MDDILRGLGAFLFERVEGREINEILHIEIERGRPARRRRVAFPFSLADAGSRAFGSPVPGGRPGAGSAGREAVGVLAGFGRGGRVRGTAVCAPPTARPCASFAEKIDRRFLPRPQKDQPAVATGNRHPEISLPAAFAAFGRILRETGVNMASTVQLSATREMTTDEGDRGA